MKTKELIQLLHQYDSTGNKEVLISNCDIDYIIKEPMYSKKGYLITKRDNYKQKQPSEITLSISNEKINLIPIDTFEYYRKKIIEDQEFIDIKTENNQFYWESTKIYFNKIFSLFYCKEYMKIADKALYPYKEILINKIEKEIQNVFNEYKEKYIDYCMNFKCSDILKMRLLDLVKKLFNENNNVIFSTPLLYNNNINIKSIGIKNFSFEIFENVYKFIYQDIYTTNLIDATNIHLETFDVKKSIGSLWENLLNNKIEKLLFD